MRRIFHRNDWQEEFDKNGFIKQKIFDQDQLSELIEISKNLGYGINDNEGNKKFIKTIFESPKTRLKIFTAICKFMNKYIENIFIDYEFVLTVLFQKHPGSGQTRLHQHPTIVDEEKFRSVTIWIPLSETPTYASSLNVIPGSHRVDYGIRPTGSATKKWTKG